MLTMIVCATQEGGIGYENKLPWHIKEEMKLYKETTLNHTLVMGRKTFESIGKPLKDRKTIIISNNYYYYDHPDVSIRQFDDELVKELKDSEEEIFVCGGRNIYELFMPYYDRLLISVLKDDYKADTFLPEIDLDDYQLVNREEYDEFVRFDYKRAIK